jgi:hypothetical protein
VSASRILVDHNIEGQAELLWGTLAVDGWLDLVPLQLVRLADVGLSDASSDRVVWRYAQRHGMLLLTANRRQRGQDSLKRTIQEENTSISLPVITVGNAGRLEERGYRSRCAERLIEIALDLETEPRHWTPVHPVMRFRLPTARRRGRLLMPGAIARSARAISPARAAMSVSRRGSIAGSARRGRWGTSAPPPHRLGDGKV